MTAPAARKRGGQTVPMAVRLDRMSMPLTECGCQIWMGELDDVGYGLIRVSGKIKKAHRVSWSANNGPIPEGMKVLHRCDIRCCISLNHLFVGTQADNVADMISKGRGSDNRGEQNANSKITAAQAEEIRNSPLGTVALGKQYGIGKSMVSNIKRGANWND